MTDLEKRLQEASLANVELGAQLRSARCQIEQLQARVSELLRFNNEFEERARRAERNQHNRLVVLSPAVAADIERIWDSIRDYIPSPRDMEHG